MTSFSSGPSVKLAGSDAHVAEKTAEERKSYIKNKEGDLVGNNYTIPKADFAGFLGYKPASKAELAGQVPVTGRRAIEVALQKSFSEIGEGAAKRGNTYRNMYVANGRFQNEPGREKDMIKDGFDSIHTSFKGGGTAAQNAPKPGQAILSDSTKLYLDRVKASQTESHNENVRMLELQYKFMEISKQDGVISNLMKTRHDAVSRTIRGGQ